MLLFKNIYFYWLISYLSLISNDNHDYFTPSHMLLSFKEQISTAQLRFSKSKYFHHFEKTYFNNCLLSISSLFTVNYFNQIDFKENIAEAESIQIDEKKKKKNDDDEEEFEEDSEMFDTVSDLNDYLKKINSKSF